MSRFILGDCVQVMSRFRKKSGTNIPHGAGKYRGPWGRNPQNGRACPVSQYHNKLTR